ncbi:MAG: hypothetical protein EBT82_00950 [Micrococcales bacterium]|nr:hypothetical protein [Micrococcales bacterium]NBR54540.1 hypothetical protein [Micrococcales bacterium]NBY43878.1 hypothetical protein [Micrococcales bacterium]
MKKLGLLEQNKNRLITLPLELRATMQPSNLAKIKFFSYFNVMRLLLMQEPKFLKRNTTKL